MGKDYFNFKGKKYGAGTIIKIYKNAEKYFKFNSMLKFKRYNSNENLYCFTSLYDTWQEYKMTDIQLNVYIENVVKECIWETSYRETETIDPKYIDGILSAWIWYIIIMFFALFLNGIGNKIITLVIISIIFWSWRKKKINGE